MTSQVVAPFSVVDFDGADRDECREEYREPPPHVEDPEYAARWRIVSCIGHMIERVREHDGVLSTSFQLHHPQGVHLRTTDFLPMSIALRDDAGMRTLPSVPLAAISVRSDRLVIASWSGEVVPEHGHCMSRGVIELHIGPVTARYFRGRRLAYGENIY